MSLDGNSRERLVPEHIMPDDVRGGEALQLHLARYEFAATHVRARRILDIACGAGYGTRLLADRHPDTVEALGVDISNDVVDHARNHYGGPRIEYRVGDGMRFSDADGFDTIVSLETIEHVPDPAGFVSRMVALLRPRGVFIGSVPTTPSVDANPNHLHDFTESSFRSMLMPHGLTEIANFRQTQPFDVIPLLQRTEARTGDLRSGLVSYYLANPSALVRRIGSTISHGFTNRYITIVWQRPD